MRNLRRYMLFILLIAMVASNYATVSKNAGRAGAKFLDLPVGAEDIALNFSANAMHYDATAIAGNPSLISLTERTQVYLSHSFWFQGISYDFLSYIFNITKLSGRLGVGIKFYKTDEIGHTEKQTQTKILSYFRATAKAVYFAYSDYINKNLIYGVTSILLGESIYDRHSYGIAFNLGMLYKVPREELLIPEFQKKLLPMRISFALKNIGYKTAFIHQSDILPMKAQFSIYYRIFDRVDLGLGALIPIDDKIKIAGSSSYTIKKILRLNVGYAYSLGGNDNGVMQGLTSGFSILLNPYRVEYAFQYFEYLGLTNHISINITF